MQYKHSRGWVLGLHAMPVQLLGLCELRYNQRCQTTPNVGGRTLEAKAKILASKPSFWPIFWSECRGMCYEAK